MKTSNVLFWFMGSACILASTVVVVGVMGGLEAGRVTPESSDLWMAVILALALVAMGGWMWIGAAVGASEGEDEPEGEDERERPRASLD